MWELEVFFWLLLFLSLTSLESEQLRAISHEIEHRLELIDDWVTTKALVLDGSKRVLFSDAQVVEQILLLCCDCRHLREW